MTRYKVSSYFITKEIADKLKAGEKVEPVEIALFGYGDLPDHNNARVRANDPGSLIACDLVIGECA